MPATLEILIPTTHNRKHFLDRLVKILQPQIDAANNRAWALFELDQGEDDGGLPIGAKRNKLVKSATAQYVSFVDDDDLVSDDYVAVILDAIDRGRIAYTDGVDVIGIEGLKINEDGKTERIIQSLQFKTRSFKTGAWLSYPTHLNPVRRTLALETPFPSISFGEDGQYSAALRPKLKTEMFSVKRPIYFYEYRRVKKERIKCPNPSPG